VQEISDGLYTKADRRTSVFAIILAGRLQRAGDGRGTEIPRLLGRPFGPSGER
jgi:hypothetical protein